MGLLIRRPSVARQGLKLRSRGLEPALDLADARLDRLGTALEPDQGLPSRLARLGRLPRPALGFPIARFGSGNRLASRSQLCAERLGRRQRGGLSAPSVTEGLPQATFAPAVSFLNQRR